MVARLPLAWLQLSQQKVRLLVAILGVAFAVVLVSMQLGFRSSIYESAVRLHRALNYDLVLISPKTPFIGAPESFSRRRLYQALAADSVTQVAPVYLRQGYWKNPWTFHSRNLLIVGFDPDSDVFLLPQVREQTHMLKRPDATLFDARSRTEFGPVAARFIGGELIETQVGNRHIHIAGLFELGTSFGINGTLITSDLNYRRIFPDRPAGFIELGLVQIDDAAVLEAVQEQLRAALESDVEILTREDFIQREYDYWSSTTPIGYVFGFGAIMGLVVGCVVVYQILYADVSEHLAEYATLKAVGYRNRDLSALVLKQAGMMSILGFVPGMIAVVLLYNVMAEATRLPLAMTPGRFFAVLFLTLGMCAVSGLIALRRVRAADPAEVFG
jgi:putative ABC transport system permease protein